MAVLVLGAMLLDREASVLNSLALAGLVILAVRPQDLLDPGFQLSFAATLGLVLAPVPRSRLAAAGVLGLAVQAAVLPVGLVHFNQLSTLAPLANLGVVPLAAAATLLGLLAVVLDPVAAPVARALLDACWPLLLGVRAVAALVAGVPGATVHLPAPHATAVVAYAVGLGLALAWWRGRGSRAGRRAGAAALASLAAAVALALWPLVRPPDGLLRVAVLDVGQGDAIVVEMPDGRAVLVDAGPAGPWRTDTGERVVAPFLWNRGVLRLAAAVTTHADGDHAAGMGSVLARIGADEQWHPGAPPGERWLGGVWVRSIGTDAVPASPPGTRTSSNDGSLVLRLDHGAVSFLLAADIEAARERRLVAGDAALDASVLKVAHHGSRTSTTPEFLRRAAPRIAVISVGARNPYGHPAPSTLRALAATGARVYRTDRDGAVLFETDGAVLTVTRWATRATDRYCLDPGGVC
jgi:competence protein ComEC